MPTDADHALIDYAASRGKTLTARQLKRWRTERLLPPRRVRGLGRGRGVVGIDTPWTRFQVVAVAQALDVERDDQRAALRLWYDGWDIPTALIADQVRVRLGEKRAGLDDLRAHVARAQQSPDGTVSPFDVAESDSRSLRVSRAERMRLAAMTTPGETAWDLVHAVRAATEGQLLSPPGEVSAIPEELAKHYFNFARSDGLFRELGGTAQPAFEEWEEQIRAVNPDQLFAAPTDAQLINARWRLRYLYYVMVELTESYVASPEEAFAVEALRAVCRLMPPTWDPRLPTHDLTVLLDALAMPSKLHERVEFAE